MTRLTTQTVVQAMATCASNAADLISDAELLRAHGRSSRAFLLYNSATEELAPGSRPWRKGGDLFEGTRGTGR